MLPIDRIPVWTLWRRIRFLRRFRDGMEEYFSTVVYEAFPFRVVEGEEARRARVGLEQRLARARSLLRMVGEKGMVRFVPGEKPGEVQRVNLISVAFELDRFSLGREDLFKVLNTGIAAYEAEVGRAWIRTLNPVYWLDMLLSVAEVTPFLPLRMLGMDAARAAATPTGRVVRVLLRAGVLSALVVLTVVGLGWQDRAVALGGRIFQLFSAVPWRAAGP